MIALSPQIRVFLYRLPTDMRKSFNGLYAVAHCNPATYPACFDGAANGWDGTGYRIAEPYCSGSIRRREDGSENMAEGEPIGEFRHLLTDIFNGLVESGLVIKGVWEDPRSLQVEADADPGSDEHMLGYLAMYFTVLAQKPDAGT